MQNVTMKVKDQKLTIQVDLSQEFGYSKSGKTITIASTKGNKDIPDSGGAVIGLNIYKYPPRLVR